MSLSSVLYVCAAATLFPAFGAKKTSMSRHQLELKEHYEHLATIAGFQCDEPQPRLLAVHELFSDLQLRGKAFFPQVTVLHRCDRHAGSCNDATHQCGPTHTSVVKIPFKVTYLEAIEGHATGEWRMEYYPLQNHTSCGCLLYGGVPPPKAAGHPTLEKPQNCLPLDSNNHKPRGNLSSYDVPLYQFNNTLHTSRNESTRDYTPNYDVSKLSEGKVKPKPKTKTKPKPEETSQHSGTTYSAFPGYHFSFETSVANEIDSPTTPSTPSKPATTTTPPSVKENCDGCDLNNDGDDTTIPIEFIRFGHWDH